MTSTSSPDKPASSDDTRLRGQAFPNYICFDLEGNIQVGYPPTIESDRSDHPPYTEYRKWFLRYATCILPYRNSLIDDHDPIRCPGSTVKESGPPLASPSFTSTAIDKEIQLETRLVREFDTYVEQAQEETFADGMDSTFADHIHQSIQTYGATAVAAWERTLRKRNNAYETGEELLRQLGIIKHTPSQRARLNLLTDELTSPDPRIRDAAGLGLSFLEDPVALRKLREAYEKEQETWLRRNLRQVIRQLESPAWRDL